MSLLESISSHLTACTIREYTAEDLPACLAIYHSNEGVYYPAGHVEKFTDFLERGTSYFLVVEHESEIVGCGGLELSGDGPWAWLACGMIHKDRQKKGLGTTLLAARLSLLEPEGRPVLVRVRTGTTAAAFYDRFGFTLHSVAQNQYGPGEHGGNLELLIRPEEVDALRATLVEHEVNLVLNDLPADETVAEQD
ncbi:N-acetylglutamate synthase-like GNAT family acetyltransferase [Roseimicrobium gellanilyticum]|uniref:N-acetylglutamate synthase-like GNAT family acetyltransferase n=1 Tax=Roseimicrobium gellanilyticum TaxID=748857 RepID=A0A366HRD6_9BACT|nr:GNAT family N-acetyltransferase [Roseimicrobium gellanilyticum]RBP45638.1 N-acetylglutamate synthase-like GNAT family acetyltransferase [Roseimicrobium gellanilyticum]